MSGGACVVSFLYFMIGSKHHECSQNGGKISRASRWAVLILAVLSLILLLVLANVSREQNMTL